MNVISNKSKVDQTVMVNMTWTENNVVFFQILIWI